MNELVRSLVVAGLLSGTQPITITGLLILRTGANGPRNSFAFVAGAFTIESIILVFASLFLGNTVEADSEPGRLLLITRLVLGVVFVIAGLRLRRPALKEVPEVPPSLQRLRNLGLGGSFVAGILLADYVGPALASSAIAASSTTVGQRLAAALVYTILATGIPLTLLFLSLKRQTAADKIDGAMSWTMHHRRQITSWLALVLGTLLVADAVIGDLVVGL